MVKLAPSLACVDLLHVGDVVRDFERNGIDYIHFDISDTTFCKTIMLPMGLVPQLKKFTDLPLDIHIMTGHPEDMVDAIKGPLDENDIISVQVEGTTELSNCLLKAKETCRCGAVLNMATPVTVLEYVAESTGNRKADWKVTAEINYFEPVSQEISIPNHSAPVAVNDAPLTLCCDGEKVPGFLGGMVGKETAADDPLRTISTHDLFTDADNDQLEYSLPVFLDASGEALDAEKISTDPAAPAEDGKYLIRFSGDTTGVFHDSFSARLVVTATDGDGQVTEYTRSVTVVDLYNRMMTYLVILLIAIVLLIILILIIHQIRKPRFPMLNMTIREEPSLFESGSETLSPVKTPTNANAIGVDSDMAAKHNISMELLQNIIVRPVRSRTSVGVACKKMIPGHEVMLEDVQMKAKKHYIWRVGQELSVRSQSGEGLVAIKLEDRSSIDSDSQVMQGFGGDGDWSAADQEQTVTSAERRHSRQVERKNKPAQEETFSGGNDDFDF